MDADIGAHRQFDAVEREIHLTRVSARRRALPARGSRRPTGTAPAPWRDTSGGISARLSTNGAGIIAPAMQPVAHRRIEIVRTLAQPVEMQRGAFGGGDDIGRGAGARGFGDLDGARRAQRLGDAGDGFDAPPGRRCSGNSRRQSRSAGRRCPARATASPARPAASCTRHPRGRAPASRHRPARDRRHCARTGRDDRGSRRTESERARDSRP